MAGTVPDWHPSPGGRKGSFFDILCPGIEFIIDFKALFKN
jgi:hypothetical protein